MQTRKSPSSYPFAFAPKAIDLTSCTAGRETGTASNLVASAMKSHGHGLETWGAQQETRGRWNEDQSRNPAIQNDHRQLVAQKGARLSDLKGAARVCVLGI